MDTNLWGKKFMAKNKNSTNFVCRVTKNNNKEKDGLNFDSRGIAQ